MGNIVTDAGGGVNGLREDWPLRQLMALPCTISIRRVGLGLWNLEFFDKAQATVNKPPARIRCSRVRLTNLAGGDLVSRTRKSDVERAA